METQANLDQEILFIKTMHEDFVSKGFFVSPMIVCFRKGVRQAAVRCRDMDNGEEDKVEAFREMFSMCITLRSDEVLFAADSWVVTADKIPKGSVRDDPRSFECLNLLLFQKEGRKVLQRSYPYLKDSDRNVFYIQVGDEPMGNGEESPTGIIVDTVNMCWEKEASGMTKSQHAEFLHDLGHSVLLFDRSLIRQDWL